MLCDIGSRVFFEVSFVDVSSVESGCWGRDGYEVVLRIFKKIRKLVVRGIEIYFDLDDEIEKVYKIDVLKKDIKGFVKFCIGIGVWFNV